MPRTADDDLRIARALAIEAYAGVESAMVVLLGRLLDTTNDKAAIIFFRITNTSARNAIVTQLLEAKHAEKYDTYWHGQPGSAGKKRIPGLFSLISDLDQRRNEIVHWHSRAHASSDGNRWEDLAPAYHWARMPTSKPIYTSDLDEFSRKALFVQMSIFYFAQFTTKDADTFNRAYSGERETWSRIFEQPITYPPESDHPLVRILAR